MTTEDSGDLVAAREIKQGDRLLIRRDGQDDAIVVVDSEPAEGPDGTVSFTARRA